MEKGARLFYILNWHKMFFVECLKMKKKELMDMFEKG